jgi:hypothetical protein
MKGKRAVTLRIGTCGASMLTVLLAFFAAIFLFDLFGNMLFYLLLQSFTVNVQQQHPHRCLVMSAMGAFNTLFLHYVVVGIVVTW